jgi:PKD repeat protein
MRKINRLISLITFLNLACFASHAATVYVWENSPSQGPPYASWSTAAHVLQDAVDAAQPNDTVLVTNGIYATGGRAVGTNLIMNRVAIDKGIKVRSVNGPTVTMIQGAEATGGGNGNGAIRCAYVGTNAVLSGFTLTNGHTRTRGNSSEQSGGGVWCARGTRTVASGTASNCVLVANSANSDGGGSYQGELYSCVLTENNADYGGGGCIGTLSNCIIYANSATEGGGAFSGTAYNCTFRNNWAVRGGAASGIYLFNCVVTGNTAVQGGGGYYTTLRNCTLTGNSALEGGGLYRGGTVYQGPIQNSILCYNAAVFGANAFQSTVSNSCLFPDSVGGFNNLIEDPQLASPTHLSSDSPCIGVGKLSYTQGVDLDGETWLNPPCIGADQVVVGSASGPLSVAIGGVVPCAVSGFQLALIAEIEGRTTSSVWDFGDGTVVSNRPYASHGWALPGVYFIRLTAFNNTSPGGITATASVQVVERPVYYVNRANPNPVFPFTTWETAATTIQDAADASAVAGRLIWVTNGIYDSGGRVVVGRLNNRVALTNAVEVRSVNGPAVTIIRGAAASSFGDGAVRCVYMSAGALLNGFTLTNGHTRAAGDIDKEQSGGGVCCEMGAVVTNCVLVGNAANQQGGGAFRGSLYDCVLSQNVAAGPPGTYYFGQGGGASMSALYHCTLFNNSALDAGGAYASLLLSCILKTNQSYNFGGGTCFGSLYNCLLTGNSARSMGGGAYNSTLYNCTISRNSASSGGGVAYPELYNSVVYYNTATKGSNYYFDGSATTYPINYSCTSPMPTNGLGNITNEPAFMGLATGDFRLRCDSPCIDVGTNLSTTITNDLDGNWRPLDGNGDGLPAFDMGTYEYSPQTADSDLDGATDLQETIAGTNPLDAQSSFRLATVASGPPFTLTVFTVSGRFYTLLRSAALGPGAFWAPVQDQINIPGTGRPINLSDPNPPAAAFYRVAVGRL